MKIQDDIQFKKIIKLLKRNIEFISFFVISYHIVSTTFYNNNKILINENYKDVINNIYFQKTINHIFDNLTPRYKNIIIKFLMVKHLIKY